MNVRKDIRAPRPRYRSLLLPDIDKMTRKLEQVEVAVCEAHNSIIIMNNISRILPVARKNNMHSMYKPKDKPKTPYLKTEAKKPLQYDYSPKGTPHITIFINNNLNQQQQDEQLQAQAQTQEQAIEPERSCWSKLCCL